MDDDDNENDDDADDDDDDHDNGYADELDDDDVDDEYDDEDEDAVFFKIKHPCSLGSGVTNLLLTCRQSTLSENEKGIGRKP